MVVCIVGYIGCFLYTKPRSVRKTFPTYVLKTSNGKLLELVLLLSWRLMFSDPVFHQSMQKYGIIHQTSAFLWSIGYCLIVIRDTLPSVLIMRYNVRPSLRTTFMGRTVLTRNKIACICMLLKLHTRLKPVTRNMMTYLSVDIMSWDYRSTQVGPISLHSTWKS